MNRMLFSSTVEELRLQMENIHNTLSQMGKAPGPLGIINDPEREHMSHPEFRDELIETFGFCKELPYIEFSPGIDNDANYASHGYGYAVYKTGTDDTLKEPILYAHLNIPSEIKEYPDSYVVVSKALLSPLLAYWSRLDVPEDVIKTVKPILDERFLQDIIDSSFGFLMRREEIAAYNVKLRRGILLDGDPGNGKTMTMRYIRQLCQEKNIRTRNITASQLMSAFQEDMLEEFMSCAPVMFFDDIDVSFFNRRRNEGGDGRMCCALLSAMDGMNEGGHCIRIFSTNEKIEDMDPAFKRPGRIDRVFSFELPKKDKRLELVQTWHKEITTAISPDDIVEQTEGMSFAETDSIKDLLVTNRIFGDKKWNLSRALEMYSDTQSAKIETKKLKDMLADEGGEETEPKKSQANSAKEPAPLL